MWGLRLAVTVLGCFSVRSFAEQRLLCSSDSVTLWWEYEGPVVITSLEFVPCAFSTDIFLTCTAMPMFTAVRMGWRMIALYQNNTWVEFSEPLGPCEDYRMCDVIKGETIRETMHFHIRHMAITPAGEYQFNFTLNIIDDFEEEFTVRLTFILELR